MQIDPSFIPKICVFLTQRIVDFEQSSEQQMLGLLMLKELIATPMTNEEKAKKQNTKINLQLKKMQMTVQKIGKINKFKRQASMKTPHLQQVKEKKELEKGSSTKGRKMTQQQLKLQDIQSQEYVFCIQNEKTILRTLNMIIPYYNYEFLYA